MRWLLAAAVCLLLPLFSATAGAQSSDCVAWGSNTSVPVLPIGQGYSDCSSGLAHSAAVRTNGSAVAWGDNAYGQCNLPPVSPLAFGLHYVQVAAGWRFTIARRLNNSVVAVGDNSLGQCNVPVLPAGITFVKVAAGPLNAAALLSNGAIVVWGDQGWNLARVPVLPAGVRYVQVSVGISHVLALRSDGIIIAWGDNQAGECDVPPLPAGLTYVEVAAGHYFSLARRSNGSVVAWGSNGSGECNLPPLPFGLSYVEIAAGAGRSVARRSDGSVVDTRAASTVPVLPAGITYLQISACLGGLARIGSTSSFVTFGAGCAGSMPPTSLVSLDTPRVGTTCPIMLDNLPNNVALVFLGLSRSVGALGWLPVELSSFGMPGCHARISMDHSTVVIGTGGRALYNRTIPNSTTLAGLSFHLQALVPDAAAPNALGAVLSDAATAVVGYR